jgi:hypothetical protein
MGAGWDVLLSGERTSIGRMDVDGLRVQGKMSRVEGGAGFRVVLDYQGAADPGEKCLVQAA